MSTLKTNRIEQVANTNLPQNLLPVTASAWVNFNGTGTLAIRDSHNISSITDNGTGDYGVNFTTTMNNPNYSVGGTCSELIGDVVTLCIYTGTTPTTTSVRISARRGDNVRTDISTGSLIFFGGQ